MININSIAFRLWMGINLILLIGTISFSGVYLWKESKSIEEAFKNEAITVVTTMNSVIGVYMLQENYDEITPFANALLERPYVQYVEVRNQYGNVVNVKGSMYTDESLFLVKVPLLYFQKVIGEVEVGLTTEAIDRQKKELIHYMIVLLIIISLLAMLISSLLSRKLTEPIHNLVQASKDLAIGKRDISVIEKGPVEMQELAIAFNQMALTIHNQENHLKSEIERATWSLSEKINILETVQKISHSVIGNNYSKREAILEIIEGLNETIKCDHLSIVTWKLNEDEEVNIYRKEENEQAHHLYLHHSFFSYDELTLLDGPVCVESQYINRYPWIEVPIKSILILPLIVHNKSIGILCLGHYDQGNFNEVFLDQYAVIYKQVALALDMVKQKKK